jgi:predicted HTH domain antitoxin
MSRVTLELDDDLVAAMGLLDQPPQQAARELIVLELYRREVISSGKAAELLGMSKLEFIQYSGKLGIPYFRMSNDEWQTEVSRVRST